MQFATKLMNMMQKYTTIISGATALVVIPVMLFLYHRDRNRDKYYGVENIIRIGSCGSYKPELKLFDIILAENVISEGNFALTLNNEDCHIVSGNYELNKILEETAKENNISLWKGNTVCTDAVDFYMTNPKKFINRIPKNINPIAAEMEAFALFYNAKLLNKKA